MATIRRAGFGTVFELEDSKVGIGTDAATHTLQALGNIRSEDATDIGISSLTTYQGFVDKEARFTTGQIDNQSQSGSTSGEIVIDGDVTVSSATTFTSGPKNLTVTDTFTLPSGDTNSREDKPTPGSLRFNQDLATLEFYTGNNWATVNTFTDIQKSPGNRGRGVFAGGRIPADTAIIDFINIATLGNAIDFGRLIQSRTDCSGMSNEIRGIWAGGKDPAVSTHIDYVTLASEGNGVDFGDVAPAACGASGAAASSSTRGVFALGQAPGNSNILSFLQIMTTGNSVDFGDLTGVLSEGAGCGSETRGIINKGQGSLGNDFFTIASKGDATDFGEDTGRIDSQRGCGSCSNSTRGLFAGGGPSGPVSINVIRYITIASTGNAIDFGDRTIPTRLVSAAANRTRGVFTSGLDPSVNYNVIDFVTISTLGDATDFGDLTQVYHAHTGVSDSHGGLGGF